MKRLILAAIVVPTILVCLSSVQAIAEDNTTSANVSPATDSQIFKRTPVVDGNVEDGEWDNYYNISADGLDASTYVDWDSSNIYFAVKANQPVEALISIDGNADGWYNGDDNYDIRLTKDGAADMRLHVGRYDSKKAKAAVSAPLPASDIEKITAKTVDGAGSSMIEIKVPVDILPSVSIADGKNIGILFAIRKSGNSESNWIPFSETGQTTSCELVTKKIAALKPILIGFDLRDNKIARGEELIGKFHLTNNGNESVDIQNFVIAGEGKSGEFLSSEKVRLDGLVPKKHVSTDVRSIIPTNMPLGSWAIGAEVKTNNNRIGGALVSFEVVEPYEVELKLPRDPVYTNAKDVTMTVNIKNNCRHSIRGTVKITLPNGWELWRNASSKEFTVTGEDAKSAIVFKAKQPIGALGKVPVKVEVESDGLKKTAEGSFELVNIL